MTGARLAVLTAAVTLLVAAPAGAALGPFDPGFGHGGRLALGGLGDGPSLTAMAPDPLGGFVLAGTRNGAAGQSLLLRLSNSGRVDSDFGDASGPPLFYFPAALAAVPGGGWVTTGALGETSTIGVVAYRADGSLDATFGSGGVARPELGGAAGSGSALAVLPDGRLLVGGSVFPGSGERRWVVARFRADGTADPTWGVNGVTQITLPDNLMCDEEYGYQGLFALLPSTSGNTLVVGTVADTRAQPVPFLARLRTDGTLDPGFGSNGTMLRPPAGGTGTVAGAVPRGSGGATIGLTLGNLCDDPTPTSFGAMAVKADGSLDELFGDEGTASLQFPADVRVRAIARLGSGGFALAGGIGDFPPNITQEVAVARLTAQGRRDRRFGGGRTCSEVLGNGQDAGGRAVLALPGNRLLVGGNTGQDSDKIELIRYRGAFAPGGVECYWPVGPGTQPVKNVRLRAILGRRGRLRLLVAPNVRGRRPHFRRVCFETAGPGGVVALWDGRVAGRTLKPGPYRTVLELRDRRGKLLGRSYQRVIDLPHRASGPKRSGAC